jgi:membrane-bound ClpP family serine protease
MKPHVAYRAAVVLIPLGVLLMVLEALLGSWLGVGTAAVLTAGGVVNLLAARRRGIGWHGPKTFRELRAMEAERREQT